ncbi:MAG: RNA polymerase subunit sigma [Sandaracinus sp.]|nr:RNA polymerase subunit sigma [Myxococcales bacterium]MAT28330.1 RNA polymerase subunit sigma [Sandaracinus sp.]
MLETMGELADVFEAHRRRLWGLCYRLTGSGADADELVQETFARALERPPPDRSRPWGPWLTRVAANLARDALRKRRRRGYVGPWLPEPVETRDGPDPLVEGPLPPDARYEQRESATLAFLVALEALTPKQRAVLLLRDVYDLSTRETAAALELKEGAVKVLLHRARAALEGYDARRPRSLDAEAAATRHLLERLLLALGRGEVEPIRALLHEDVVSINDGAGSYHAARRPVGGVDRVALFLHKTRGRALHALRPVQLNGLPAVLVEQEPRRPGWPPRAALLLEVEGERIRRLLGIVADAKLARLPFDAAA